MDEVGDATQEARTQVWRETEEEWSYRIVAGSVDGEHLHLTAEYVNGLEDDRVELGRLSEVADGQKLTLDLLNDWKASHAAYEASRLDFLHAKQAAESAALEWKARAEAAEAESRNLREHLRLVDDDWAPIIADWQSRLTTATTLLERARKAVRECSEIGSTCKYAEGNEEVMVAINAGRSMVPMLEPTLTALTAFLEGKKAEVTE